MKRRVETYNTFLKRYITRTKRDCCRHQENAARWSEHARSLATWHDEPEYVAGWQNLSAGEYRRAREAFDKMNYLKDQLAERLKRG